MLGIGFSGISRQAVLRSQVTAVPFSLNEMLSLALQLDGASFPEFDQVNDKSADSASLREFIDCLIRIREFLEAAASRPWWIVSGLVELIYQITDRILRALSRDVRCFNSCWPVTFRLSRCSWVPHMQCCCNEGEEDGSVQCSTRSIEIRHLNLRRNHSCQQLRTHRKRTNLMSA